MPKRTLTASEAFDLRQALHVAVLDALMGSRRWEPGSLVFQGGTSLHLAHGSPRFSEDLDFLVDSSLRLDSLSTALQARLMAAGWIPADTKLSVSKAKEGGSLHSFVVSVGGEEVIGAVRVKVELWRTAPAAVKAVHAVVSPVKLATGPAAGMQAFVPTADLREIYVDKVFALAARPYLKPRDVFDLYWLAEQAGQDGLQCTPEALELRLATYPNESAQEWLEKAKERMQVLPAAVDAVQADLARWLPSTWQVKSEDALRMIDVSVAALSEGCAAMEIVAEHTAGPSP